MTTKPSRDDPQDTSSDENENRQIVKKAIRKVLTEKDLIVVRREKLRQEIKQIVKKAIRKAIKENKLGIVDQEKVKKYNSWNECILGSLRDFSGVLLIGAPIGAWAFHWISGSVAMFLLVASMVMLYVVIMNRVRNWFEGAVMHNILEFIIYVPIFMFIGMCLEGRYSFFTDLVAWWKQNMWVR